MTEDMTIIAEEAYSAAREILEKAVFILVWKIIYLEFSEVIKLNT